MPFTLSHPAAVLLVARTGLPVGAMVAGSMAPDLPMFIPVPGAYVVTHSLLGVVTADVVLGVLGVLVWVHLVRDALVDLAPAPVRERCDVTARYTRRQWLLAPVAVAVGALTHVVWDSFTHRGRWGAQHVAWLDEMHAGLPGSAWAQYASGVLGVLAVMAWAAGRLRARERQERAPRVPELGIRALGLVPVVVAVVTGVALVVRISDGLHAMAFSGAVFGTFAAHDARVVPVGRRDGGIASSTVNVKVRNIQRDPRVSIAIDGSGQRPYVAQGDAVIHETFDEHTDLVAGFAARYQGWDATDESQDGPRVLLEINVERWLVRPQDA